MRGLCTDLGTESKLVDACENTVSDWLAASWVSASQVVADDGCCSDDESPGDGGDPQRQRRYTFPSALMWPGLLHIIDGLTHNLHSKALANWEWFDSGLIALSSLLCHRGRRERFVETCVNIDATGQVGK